MPTFEALLVDDLGWLWAKLHRFDVEGPPNWLVFDRDGRGHGGVETPEGLEVRQTGPDFVLGVWRDENDVEFVRRHELRGRPPASRTP